MKTNFELLAGQWEQTYTDAARAESYGRTDPRSRSTPGA